MRFCYQKKLPLNLKNPSKYYSVNNSTEHQNFSSFENCFQHATIQYTTIQFNWATMRIN